MEQVRRLLAELTMGPEVARQLREDPSALAAAFGLSDANLEALLDVERFFDTETAVVDHIVDHTDDFNSGVIGPEQPSTGSSPTHECGCQQSVVTVVANFASVAQRAIESLETIHRSNHVGPGRPTDQDSAYESPPMP